MFESFFNFDAEETPIGENIPRTYSPVDIADYSMLDRFDFGRYLADAAARDAALAGRQGTFLDALQARAEGRAPSLAEMQLQQSLAQNQANAAGFMASQRGVNPALAARNVGQQQAMMAQQAAGQGAMLRAQEQLAAEQAYGNALGGFRGQDQSLFGMTAQGQQGQNALNAQQSNANRQAQLQQAQLEMQDAMAREQALQARRGQNQQAIGGLFEMGGKAASAGSTMFGASDGGEVPGRAKVEGDSEENDFVLALLSPGEVVVPRSELDKDDPGEAAKAFVEACLAEEGDDE